MKAKIMKAKVVKTDGFQWLEKRMGQYVTVRQSEEDTRWYEVVRPGKPPLNYNKSCFRIVMYDTTLDEILF